MGGEAIADSLRKAFPEATILVVNDSENVPYGSKTTEEIIRLTDAAIQPLLKDACDIIILACNTATIAAIKTLRDRYPTQQFIGLEPMVKPAAAMTETGVIAVCATPFTLASERYAWLVETYAHDIRIIEPDCSRWARMIENGHIDRTAIANTITQCYDEGADVIVLGCTHYIWIKDLIEECAGAGVQVIEPSEAIVRRIKSLLATK